MKGKSRGSHHVCHLCSADQALATVLRARALLLPLGPFTRPHDYFADMLKSDAHMQRLQASLVAEATDLQAREARQRQRALKQVGKAVQVAKRQAKEADQTRLRETLDLLKKRKHTHPV